MNQPSDLDPNARAERSTFGNRLITIGLSLFTALTLCLAIFSLWWETFWDLTIWHYLAYAFNEHGYVPYRDIFEVNMFGTIFMHVAFTKVFGYHDLAFRIFDLVLLSALSACTYRLLKPFGSRSGWFAAVLFAWLYLSQGEGQMLQRDYIVLLPLAMALCVLVSPVKDGWWKYGRSVAMGICIGIAVSFKPQAGIGLPVLLYYEAFMAQGREPLRGFSREWLKRLVFVTMWAFVGFAIPMLSGLLWLWWIGALPAFIDTILNYWPIYKNYIFEDGWRVVDDAVRRQHYWDGVLTFRGLFGRFPLFIAAGMTLAMAWDHSPANSERRRISGLLGALVIAYYLGLVLIGHFHPYAWLQVLYLCVLLTSLAFALPMPMPGRATRWTWCFIVLILLYMAVGRVPVVALRQWNGEPPVTPWTSRVREIEGFLKERLRPGDKVQPLDSLGGVLRAMTMVGAEPATRITVDAYLQFLVKEPYIKSLRLEFMETLRKDSPRFVILVHGDRLFGFDINDDGSFKRELLEFLSLNYRSVFRGSGYQILELSSTNKPQ